MSTEYRILPVPSDAVGITYYLQFKTLKTNWLGKVKEVWKYVPKYQYNKTILDPAKCLEKNGSPWEVLTYYDFSKHEIDNFIKNWPDIQLYFDHLKKLVDNYNKRVESEKVTYLNN